LERKQRNNHRFWKVMKSIRGKYGKQVRSVKNRNDVLVTKTAEVLAAWKDYFEEKFGRVELEHQCKRCEVKDKDREEGTEMEKGIANIERAKLEKPVGQITLWKAAGADDISPELIKYGGHKLIDEMTKLFVKPGKRKAYLWIGILMLSCPSLRKEIQMIVITTERSVFPR
jgi:hypothetical protein